MAVSAQQDLDPWPMGANGADQPEQESAHFLAGRTTRRAQHCSNRTALAVKNDDRLETVLIVVGVKQPELLTTKPSNAAIRRTHRE